MFGYVVINEPELKVREHKKYKGIYCGLCQILKRKYGPFGQLCLNNDMTFMALLHMSLYEGELPGTERDYRCKLHPIKKVHIYDNLHLEYAADMTMILGFYLARDHWKDDRQITALIHYYALRKKVWKLSKVYPRQHKAVKNYVRRLEAAERANEQNLDHLAGLTGQMLAEIFDWKSDAWADMLNRVGFYLGKFIYIMDAYEDLETDIEKRKFNPLIPYKEREDFEDFVYGILDLMMADCARSFEQLPLEQDIEILRNILYAGVWSKYMKIRNDTNKMEEPKDESL